MTREKDKCDGGRIQLCVTEEDMCDGGRMQ